MVCRSCRALRHRGTVTVWGMHRTTTNPRRASLVSIGLLLVATLFGPVTPASAATGLNITSGGRIFIGDSDPRVQFTPELEGGSYPYQFRRAPNYMTINDVVIDVGTTGLTNPTVVAASQYFDVSFTGVAQAGTITVQVLSCHCHQGHCCDLWLGCFK